MRFGRTGIYIRIFRDNVLENNKILNQKKKKNVEKIHETYEIPSFSLSMRYMHYHHAFFLSVSKLFTCRADFVLNL